MPPSAELPVMSVSVPEASVAVVVVVAVVPPAVVAVVVPAVEVLVTPGRMPETREPAPAARSPRLLETPPRRSRRANIMNWRGTV